VNCVHLRSLKHIIELPSRDPDEILVAADIVDAPILHVGDETDEGRLGSAMGVNPVTCMSVEEEEEEEEQPKPSLGPFKSESRLNLMDWSHRYSTVTPEALNSLATDVLTHPNLTPEDFVDFDAKTEIKRFDQYLADQAIPQPSSDPNEAGQVPFGASDQWHCGEISIPMPCAGRCFASEKAAPQLVIKNVWYHKLPDVIKSAVQSDVFDKLHLKPFKLFRKFDDGRPPTRVYGETYTSNCAINIERAKLEAREKGEDNEKDGEKEDENQTQNDNILETVLLWLIFFSDATHLTNFGNASLWPIYVWISNWSKYPRGQVKNYAAHHLAYLPKILFTTHIEMFLANPKRGCDRIPYRGNIQTDGG
ncbi:hypothetical protein MPER_02898, partial [Moniliophthora perniciosa FA553]